MTTEVSFGRQATVDGARRSKLTKCWEWIFKQTPDDQGAEWEIVVKNNSAGQPDHHLRLQLQSNQITGGFITSYRHTLRRTQSNDAADDMVLRNDDELLMLNNKVASLMPHEDLKRELYNLKVDGQSTITMMIRRKKKNGKWKWYNVHIILSPYGCCEGEDTSLKCTKCERLTNRETVFESDHVYRIPGSQNYLQLDNNGLHTNTMSGKPHDVSNVDTTDEN